MASDFGKYSAMSAHRLSYDLCLPTTVFFMRNCQLGNESTKMSLQKVQRSGSSGGLTHISRAFALISSWRGLESLFG